MRIRPLSTAIVFLILLTSCAPPLPTATPTPLATNTPSLPQATEPPPLPTATPTPLHPPPAMASKDDLAELWQLSFENHPAGLTFSAGIAWDDVLLAVSSQGVLYRLDAQTGRVQMQLPLWPEGPRGVGGAQLARVGDYLLVGLSDLFMETPRSRFSSFRSRLLLVDPRGEGRIVRDLATSHNGTFAWLVSGHRLLIYAPLDVELVAVDGGTGQMLWRYQSGRGSLLAADDQTFYVVKRPALYVPYDDPEYTKRQQIVALDAQTGEVRWEVTPTLVDDVRQAILSEGRLVLVGEFRTSLALAVEDGHEIWRSEVELSYYNDIVAGDGLLYTILPRTNNIVALSLADGHTVWQTPLQDYGQQTLILANGHLYLTTTDYEAVHLRIQAARTGESQQTIPLGMVADWGYYSNLAAIGQRVYAFGNSVRAFGPTQQVAQTQPPPIAPMTLVTRALPVLPIYYESTYSGTGNVWRALSNGSLPQNVSNSGDDNWDPMPSPDGEWIAFQSYRTGTSELWLMRSDGGDQHPLTETNDPNIYNYHPNWSPDSQRIAFASNRDGEHQIWVMNRDGSDAHPLTGEGRNVDPAWSPDGKTIVFVSNRDGDSDLWQMDADGSNQHPLTRDPQTESSPAWSPDGRMLAYVAHTPEMGDEWGQIMLFNLGNGLRWFAPYTQWGQDRNPSFSPDGTRLAWARKTDDPGKPNVWIARLDTQASPTFIENAKDPSWAPLTP